MSIITVKVSKQDEDFHFRGVNTNGNTVDIDDATAYDDGIGQGVSPMQLLVMALGGCSGVDIMSILIKSRQRVDSFDMEITGEKPDGVSPSIFHTIQVRFILQGDLDPKKVKRAIELSLGKYCSVAATLGKAASISYDYVVNGDDFEGSAVYA